ncbi:3-oxoacyl-(acyl-carrier-protein) reductase [Cryptobacterium curtum DSM 15641]|uniref:3-oxoacyl-[acyl-carrier-protein] reductase n=1 Tax=Cryptobacterium curtum (strain ATCC 700683 / DSM 15641 / CCUG 43107 / 12-3) TaxID=469378 RepID=C7MPG3_CRYCD|nr:3-oxoacyl-[acyl-carrier-protein] reductase [Cryptobacterium curtum]ACU94803.1 3-oxoacyl-(acyl-carrier-protein) reductase [Cryptobacterium curtum DSM 15641]
MQDINSSELERCAVVTGSSRGIGKAIAERLAQDGCNIIVNCSHEGGLPAAQQTADNLAHDYGVQAIAIAADVSREDEAKRLIDGAISAFGRVDILVNNAGITRDGLIMRMKEADFDAVINVNLKGTFNCCKAVAKPFMKQRHGRIINMSSVVGVHGNAGQANYAASKAGVIGLTLALSRELASRGVTVNAIAPGFIETDMTAALSEAQRTSIAERIGAGRLGLPDDVANLARFLASDEASYITGQVICVDGGISL